MLKKAQRILLFTLVFAAVALLGSAPAWAVKPACQEVQIFETIKFIWSPGCESLIGVFFFESSLEGCEEGCSPTAPDCDSCWRTGEPVTLTMCTCVDGEGGNCTSDLQQNIQNGREVECFTVRNSGPSLGVPLFLNPRRGCVGGRCFR